jgi:hypothetical protein
VVQEPRGTGDAFDAAMRDFYAGIDGGRGAVLFAVCRGKVRRQNISCSVSAQCDAEGTGSPGCRAVTLLTAHFLCVSGSCCSAAVQYGYKLCQTCESKCCRRCRRA